MTFPLPHTARSYLLLSILAALTVAWAAVTIHTWRLERGLKVVAEAKMADLHRHFDQTFTLRHEFDLHPEVTASQQYLLFGSTHGKIHILLRGTTETGATHFGAFDYFLVHNGDRWIETESGYCGDMEMQSEAQAVFASLK